VPINVRCYSNSDIIVRRSEVTLRARRRHRAPSSHDNRANRRASRSNRSQPKPCGPGKTTIEMGSAKKLNAHVTSDNKNQLKFRTKQYVGEFFRYTRDLFLIYKSGRLARLTCSPA